MIAMLGVQKQGHLQTRGSVHSLTSPPPPRTDRGQTRRLVLWFIVFAIVLAGVVLFFRFGTQPGPLIEQVR